jgi:hypothetical protein
MRDGKEHTYIHQKVNLLIGRHTSKTCQHEISILQLIIEPRGNTSDQAIRCQQASVKLQSREPVKLRNLESAKPPKLRTREDTESRTCETMKPRIYEVRESTA